MGEITKVWLNTWGNYNAGGLGYGWMTPEDAESFIEENALLGALANTPALYSLKYNFGWTDKALAIQILWRWPPENSWG